MIPKKIHYCWLSGEEMPQILKKCMQTWKEVMPDYELILWDKKRFDVSSVPFVEEACRTKKWAFASDYIRLYAVYNDGGIYMDTDVIVKKRFDDFLKNGFFTSVEITETTKSDTNNLFVFEDGSTVQRVAGIALQAAIIGGDAGNVFLKDCLEWYQGKHFVLPDGSFFNKILSPDIYATIATRYGFKYKDKTQTLTNDIKLYQSTVLASDIWSFNKDTYAVHCATGSWRDKSILVKMFRKNKFVRKIMGIRDYGGDAYEYVQKKFEEFN